MLGSTFTAAFWRVFRSHPRRATEALLLHLAGRRVRARNRLRITLAQQPDAYAHWIEWIEKADEASQQAEAEIARWAWRPLFSVVIYPQDREWQTWLEACVDCLDAQVYTNWELLVVRGAGGPEIDIGDSRVRIIDLPESANDGGLRAAAEQARGEYLLPLAHGAKLPPTSLFRYAEALQVECADLLYGDHDELGGDGSRKRPWFKPSWNEELALAQDYVSQAMAVRASAARDAGFCASTGGSAASYALALSIGCRKGAVVRHIPYVQAHLSRHLGTVGQAERLNVVKAQLSGTAASVSTGAHGTIRIDWPLPDPRPLVSIIVPTRDRVDLLRACLSSVDALTSYRNFEVIVVDNGSERADTLAYLSELIQFAGVRLIRDERPYNYAQLNNLAVSQAEGEYICLLNNDTEVIGSDWLTAMMRQAVRPHVGAVGARLLYDDGSIQHAGVAIGIGQAAAHAHRFQNREAPGYFARTHAAHYVSAVTAACLVVKKSKFLAVGGLDEQNFAVAFNDVDLCLKLQRAGWRNVYTPHATLMHHESKSRGKDFSPAHIDRYRRELGMLQERWGTRDYVDPLHHVHLDRASETFLIRL
jgi:O-antigen biosynthesis protein